MTKLNYHNNKDVLQLVRNIEGNRDIVENILDLLNANHSITMSLTRCNIYLCRWNGDEIVQIHTKETLYNEYKDTNLFDDDEDMLFETIGNGFDNFKFKDYLKLSSKDEDFLNVNFICDNMEITRIA